MSQPFSTYHLSTIYRKDSVSMLLTFITVVVSIITLHRFINFHYQNLLIMERLLNNLILLSKIKKKN